jgi:hypothetical protein
VTELTLEDFQEILSGDPEEIGVHLHLVDRDIEIEGQGVRVHCHCLTLDGNGKISPARLVEYMRDCLADYAIPRSKMAQAKERDQKHNSTRAVMGLFHEARATFTDLAKTGEGGELLLFLLAERFLGLPQILCKMDLKTDPQMHYHGADAIHAGITEDGVLKLYWGESKMYQSAADAVRECLRSLAPFLIEDRHEGSVRERDLVLLSDKADLNDPELTNALKAYFDKGSPKSNRVKYCGVALICFDVAFYPADDAQKVADEMIDEARIEIEKVVENVSNHLTAEKLSAFEIQLLCVPLPSVDAFRTLFRQTLGLNV